MKRFIKRLLESLKSLKNYYVLSRHGFRISRTHFKSSDLEMYRFMWNDKVVRDMPDIDRIDRHLFVTMIDGRTRVLTRNAKLKP